MFGTKKETIRLILENQEEIMRALACHASKLRPASYQLLTRQAQKTIDHIVVNYPKTGKTI